MDHIVNIYSPYSRAPASLATGWIGDSDQVRMRPYNFNSSRINSPYLSSVPSESRVADSVD